MAVCADPVLEVLGLVESEAPGSFSDAQIASAGNAFTLASLGYPPDPFASNWSAYLQAASFAAAAASLTGQLNCSEGFAQVGREENLQSTMPSALLMPQCPALPPTLPSLATEGQEQDESISTDILESPLVLPDVLPAESTHTTSSTRTLCENVRTEPHDNLLWSTVVPALPEVSPQPSAWQTTPWLPADLSGNDFAGASDLVHIFNSLGGDMASCLPTDMSAFTPTTASPERDFDSPVPSTPSAGSSRGAKEQTPVKLNLSEAIDRSNGLEAKRSPAATFELETPPPPQRWAFRADAPCFVPKDVSVVPGQQPKIAVEAPAKVVSADINFLEWRKKMLLFRSNDVTEYQTGEDNLRTVPTSSISNLMSATPQVEVESELDKTEASYHGVGKGSGHGYVKRGGKAESRGQIRALAAGARAHLASPSAEISRKDAKPDTVQSSVSNRSQYHARAAQRGQHGGGD